ncbi:ATP-dependent DNA helicase RecG [Protofrankia coriariae]|uniref:Probable DNA 3'-5' helicase RecG n=1 Tax=Protofrankia coriariae TaxID=1562887 RepID=A0ABR5F8F1_9ACTN|nr:ATP-dependent DNA helicase RecG [Protofrankia coriariae]KLL12960.1 ATP-dependent DNA helicase RecG [Protofrankia coriariae]
MVDQQTRLRDVVGARTATALAGALELETVGDLLAHLPRRYQERGELTDLADLTVGEAVTIQARVTSAKRRPLRGRGREMLIVTVSDGRHSLALTFFNQPWRSRDLRPGVTALFAGKVEVFNRRRQMTNPEVQLLDDTIPGFSDGPGEVELPGIAESASGQLPVHAGTARNGIVGNGTVPAGSGSPGTGPTGTGGDGPGGDVEGFAGGLLPIYPSAAKIPSWAIGKCVRIVLDLLTELDDPLPAAIRARYRLVSLLEAYRLVHQPSSWADVGRGRTRLKWDEALVLQVALAQRRHDVEKIAATPRHPRPDGLLAAFDASLPFSLTAGQRAVGATIAAELARPFPMHRLLQGEVGSGKTVVALRAMLAAVDAAGQAVLLAPTETLAAQHLRSLRALLGPLGRAGELDAAPEAARAVLVTGSLGVKARREALAAVADGSAGLVVGTHALLEESVVFHDLALVVVDEQHRFGVEQRDALRSRSDRPPHLLVMTATPIPRTVAMTVFGDLEASTLTELPAGRSPISTFVVPATAPKWANRVWGRIRDEVAAGRQAYVVCPRIGGDTSDADDVPGADGPAAGDVAGDVADDAADPAADPAAGPVDGARPDDTASRDASAAARRPGAGVLDVLPKLRAGELAELRVEALHGRLPPDEKEEIMTRFAAGELDVLVATTVIEVGVDVPNATVMVVMDADRFGVSQLHQLRGRVGRGSAPGWCLLYTDAEGGSPAWERLSAVAATSDGAELARLDLAQRREGDVLGAAQSGGRRSLRLLELLKDEELIRCARGEASSLVDADPQLSAHPVLAAALAATLDEAAAAYLEKG